MGTKMTTALKSEPALRRGEATMAAAFIAAYVECSEPIQKVVREMVTIVNDEESSPDDIEAAVSTLFEALFPARTAELCELDEKLFLTPQFQAASDELDQEHSAFSGRVRELMEDRGLTQSDLAKSANITQPAVNNILNRNCRPQRRTVIKFALALGVEPHELWPDVDDAEDD